MPSPEYLQFRDVLRNTPRDAQVTVSQLREWMDFETPIDAATTTITAVDADGIPAEWVCYEDSDPDKRLCYLHGGGYVSGNPARYRSFAEVLSRLSGLSVLLPDYRRGPEHPFPAAVKDATAAYTWMRTHAVNGNRQAASTFIAGDSAGGGLTLATLLALRDAGQALPNAAATVSAYADLAHTGESIRTRAGVDPLCPATWLACYADNYLCGADPRHPLASPIYADPSGLPPLLVQVGDAEVILDDSVRFATRAKAAGVPVNLSVWPEMLHVFPIFVGEFPEAEEGTAEIAAFFRSFL